MDTRDDLDLVRDHLKSLPCDFEPHRPRKSSPRTMKPKHAGLTFLMETKNSNTLRLAQRLQKAKREAEEKGIEGKFKMLPSVSG